MVLAGLAAPPVARANGPVYADPDAGDESRIESLLSAMTLEEKIQALGTDPSVPRLGLRFSGHIEGLHGVALGGPGAWGRIRSADGNMVDSPVTTTQFPQAVGLAQTWDVDVLHRVGEIESIEARYAFQSADYRRGGLVIRAPNVDLARDPRWGRTEESYGEDPFLNGTLATAFVRGLQGEDPRYWRAAALLKHFMANSNENERDHSSSNFDQQLMREYYSVPFRMAVVEGGARAFMAAYNAWNGTPMAVNPTLNSMAVGEWGEDGIICTDGGALTQLVTKHKAFPSLEAAAAAALHAGINQFLDRQEQPVRDALARHLVEEGDIDHALRGVFRVMLRLGLLDPPRLVPYAAIKGGQEPWLTEAHQTAVRWATRKSIVLLKNARATLPLNRMALRSVAVIGPYADQVLLDWYSGTPPYAITPLQGIRNALGTRTDVRFIRDDSEEAVRAARAADAAIVVVGNHPTCNAGWNDCPDPGEGKESVDRRSLDLSQEDLLKKVLAANRRTIVVLIASFPYAIDWTESHVPAILLMTHNSQESGSALADVLFGDFNPAGRLVQTWPRSIDQLPPMMDYDIRHGRTYRYFRGEPLYPFGFGLSYTQFHYASVRPVTELRADGTADLDVDVRNAGRRDGEEVVQVYATAQSADGSGPVRSLVAFRRIALRAHETKRVHLTLSARTLASWDAAAGSFVVEAARVPLLIGTSAADIRLRSTLHIGSKRRWAANEESIEEE